jgi:hypothetical protein
MENQIEIWKPIVGYEGFYEVSNLGRIKTKERFIERKDKTFFMLHERIRKLVLHKKTGYLQVSICVENKVKMCSAHRMVASTFIDNPLNKPQVNHINGIKTDNRVENLEWCTNRENTIHRIDKTKTKHKYTGIKFHNNRWIAEYKHKGQSLYLGCFKNEIDAALAYETKIKQLNKIANG